MNVIKTALLLLSAASLLTLPLNAFAQEAQGKQALLEAYTALQAQPILRPLLSYSPVFRRQSISGACGRLSTLPKGF